MTAWPMAADYQFWVRIEADEIIAQYGDGHSLSEIATETERSAGSYENGRKMALDIAGEIRRRARLAIN